jgi:hypothetical protein
MWGSRLFGRMRWVAFPSLSQALTDDRDDAALMVLIYWRMEYFWRCAEVRSEFCPYVSRNIPGPRCRQAKKEHSGALVTSPHDGVAVEEVRGGQVFDSWQFPWTNLLDALGGGALTHLLWHCTPAWHSRIPTLLSLRRSGESPRRQAKSPRSCRFQSFHNNFCIWCM